MPNPTKAMEALPAVAGKALEVAEKLLGETLTGPPAKAMALVENGARRGDLRTMISPSTAYSAPGDGATKAARTVSDHQVLTADFVLGTGKNAARPTLTLTGASREAAEKLVARRTEGYLKGPELATQHTKSGFRFVDGEMHMTGSSNLGRGRARSIEESLNVQGFDVDGVNAAKKFVVGWKTAPKGIAEKGSEIAGDKAKSAVEAAGVQGPKELERVRAMEVARRRAEPVMPTRAFETQGERKTVEKLADGSVLTEYPVAPLPFKFTDPVRPSRQIAYGDSAYTVKQLPDGSVTLGNPEGINKIGQAFEKAQNSLGLNPSKLDYNFMPKWFQARHEHLAESGVPAWFKGDRSWLYGQVNGAPKHIRPVEANFAESTLAQIRYDKPVRVGIGPFEGLTGDVMGFAKNGDAMLVNTNKMVGGKPETFVYRKGGTDIETFRLIPQAGGESEVKRVLLTPRPLLNLLER